MNKTRLSTLVALALASLSTASHAVSFTQGDHTLDINGTVNGFYTYRNVDAGGASSNTSTITNGLLPGWINFVFTTKAQGLDVKAHFGFAPGILNDSEIVGLPDLDPSIIEAKGGAAGRAYPQIDTRNAYFQFGREDLGTLKIGRDIGLFGQKIILNDMTLLGVGGTTGAARPFNTTFGMIAHGYMYTGFQPQITYTMPAQEGFQASVGIFEPRTYVAGAEAKAPGLQGLVSYDWKGEMPGSAWVGGLYQRLSDGGATGDAFDARGGELGAKISVGAAEFLAYGFMGEGLGLSTVGALFFSPNGETEARGYMLQTTYKIGDTKLGINYGENRDSEGELAGTIRNRSATLGAYHSLNKYITLVSEYNHERLTNSSVPGQTRARTISLGGILFF